MSDYSEKETYDALCRQQARVIKQPAEQNSQVMDLYKIEKRHTECENGCVITKSRASDISPNANDSG